MVAEYPWLPHVRESVEIIEDRFNLVGGTYPGHDPSESRAADFWTTSKAKHDEVFYWLIANADRLGLMYVISWKRIWSVGRRDEGVRPYTRYDDEPNPTASQLHTNHVHTSWDADAPESEPTLGVPLMADAVPIKIDFDDDQLLTKDATGAPAQHVWINDKNGASIVVGVSSGVDIRATIAVSGLKEGERVQLFFHKVWRKAGETDINKGGDDPVYITHIPGVSSPSVHFTFAGSLGKADTGWTPAIRITAKTTSETAVITRRQIRGWRLEP